jgi:hypothetical protein
MDSNPSGQKTHNGAVLRSASRRHDLTDAGSDRVIPVPAIAPSAMILILTMVVVSMGQCNTCLQSICRSLKTQSLSWSLI